MTIDSGSREFPYRQLAAAYRERISAGTFGPRLPSIVALAEEAGTRPGLGVFVR